VLIFRLPQEPRTTSSATKRLLRALLRSIRSSFALIVSAADIAPLWPSPPPGGIAKRRAGCRPVLDNVSAVAFGR
jgi:hypothetical protein